METEPLIEKIRKGHKELFSRFEPNSCILFFDQVPIHKPYHYVPAGVENVWAAISREFGESGFEAYQKVTLLHLIGKFGATNAKNRYSETIRERFAISFRRIANSIADPEFALYRSRTDIMLKDLGLCRQKIFPAGAQVVEPDSGFHRALVFRGGIPQAYEFAQLLLASGGNRHWYQIHTHLSELEDFNPDGWNRCYLRLADMLALNPTVRGMWGGSWFYDPALEEVSPRLAYLRKVPQENGAFLFFSNVDIASGALSKSDSRNKAYQEGKYLPKAYALIWPRLQLLAWAAARRAGNKNSN